MKPLKLTMSAFGSYAPVLNRTLAMVWRRKEASIPLPSGTGGTRRLDTRLWPMPTMNGCH